MLREDFEKDSINCPVVDDLWLELHCKYKCIYFSGAYKDNVIILTRETAGTLSA